MSQRLQVEQWIPVPLPKVFAFFCDPHNLPRIMPPSQGAKIVKLNLVPPRFADGTRPPDIERMAGAGTEITFKFRAIPHVPIHERWTALITEFAFNEYFSDIQKQGPFNSWHHTHTFEAKVVDGREGTADLWPGRVRKWRSFEPVDGASKGLLSFGQPPGLDEGPAQP